MDANTSSTTSSPDRPDRLAALTAAVDDLAAQDLDELPDPVRAARVLRLRRLVDRLEGLWLMELAGVDARGAAGADQDQPAPSTAGWLRSRLHMGAGTAASSVRTARALFRGPLAATAHALVGGEISVAHASVVAHGTHELPEHLTREAEPVLLEAASRLDPPRLRRVLGHLQLVADPAGADRASERATSAAASGWPQPGKAWSPWTGYWTPRPARPYWRCWSRWPVQPTPRTLAAVASAAPTPSRSWPAGAWKPAGSPRPVGSAPSCW